MFQLTVDKQAKELLDNHFQENPAPEFIRLYVRPSKSSRGSCLALKPGVKGDRDVVLEEGGYRFLLNRHLADQIGNWAKIAANGKGGFEISAEKVFNDGESRFKN